jgi:hypothetical protein
MDKTQIQEMRTAIRNRTTISPIAVSLSKMLDAYGMALFSQLCADRIADANLIDGEHTDIKIHCKSHVYDLTFDSTGLDACHDILCGYIDSDNLNFYKCYLAKQNGVIYTMNSEIIALRDADVLSLIKLIMKPSKYLGDDNQLVDEAMQLVKAELQARSPLNRVRVLVTNCINKIIRYINTYPILKLAKQTLKDCERDRKKENPH